MKLTPLGGGGVFPPPGFSAPPRPGRRARRSPDAWLINFTNPAGLVTEAVAGVLGERVVGICDSPEGLCHDVARALGRPPHDLAYDYFGLNHLGWLRAGRDEAGHD